MWDSLGRVHGGYQRCLADLAVVGRSAVIDLLVRRFVCPIATCLGKPFVEHISEEMRVRALTATA